MTHAEIRKLFFTKIEENLAYIFFKYEDIAFANSKGSSKDICDPSIQSHIKDHVQALRPVHEYIDMYGSFCFSTENDCHSDQLFEITEGHFKVQDAISAKEQEMIYLKKHYESELTEVEKKVLDIMALSRSADLAEQEWDNRWREDKETVDALKKIRDDLTKKLSFSGAGLVQGELFKMYPLWFVKGLYAEINHAKFIIKNI